MTEMAWEVMIIIKVRPAKRKEGMGFRLRVSVSQRSGRHCHFKSTVGDETTWP